VQVAYWPRGGGEGWRSAAHHEGMSPHDAGRWAIDHRQALEAPAEGRLLLHRFQRLLRPVIPHQRPTREVVQGGRTWGCGRPPFAATSRPLPGGRSRIWRLPRRHASPGSTGRAPRRTRSRRALRPIFRGSPEYRQGPRRRLAGRRVRFVVVIHPSKYLDFVFASRTGISTQARVASLTLTRP